jgi:Protein of unknown function (DUF2442)
MAKRDHFEMANERARQLSSTGPRATAARYDRKTGRVVVSLNNKLDVSFSPSDAQGLEHAQPSQLKGIEISPSGFGIHFPELDADLYVPAILEGILGSRNWMASRLGQVGGQSRSRAKKAAARANGRLGGRPRKTIGR